MFPFSQIRRWLNEDNTQPSAPAPSSQEAAAPEGYFLPWTAQQIRDDAVIKDKLRVLKRSGLALPHEIWDDFVVETVVQFASWVQELPASASYHHSGRRGLVYHSLDVAIYAMRIRRNFILPPNTPPEDVLHREIIWVYGVFLAALLHDSGKIMDMVIELQAPNGDNTIWTPALGPIGATGSPYRFRYKDDRAYATHQHLGMVFLMQLLGKDPMAAIIHDTMLFAQLSEYLSGHKDHDNVIEQIVRQADAASVAQDLGASKDGINDAAKRARFGSNSLAEQLHTTMTYLLTEKKILLNKKGGEGFVHGDHLYLICKPIADTIRRTLLDRGISSVPASNSKLFNELQQNNIIRPNEQGLAIWSCQINLTDVNWHQTFTCLCIHLPSFLPDVTFTPMVGDIVILPPEESGESVDETEALTPAPDIAPHAIESDELVTVSEPIAPNDVDSDLMNMFPGFDDSAPIEAMQDHIETVIEKQEEKQALQALTPVEIGTAFFSWVETSLKGGIHPVNTRDAFFHIVDGKLFIVSPTAMRTFVDEYAVGCHEESYLDVQDGIQCMNRHIKTASGRNLHVVTVIKSQNPINGYLVALSDEVAAIYTTNNTALMMNEG
ncbi:MobH family relaxase [Photobacterium leiognathi]|uniref:MobH family relaxase n=1 Tax=Photobacterium leiognathi TaxID=553611 RepID=UPI002981608B|nr:MobH family relaxase [Photobacterium leiognathi]